MFTNFLWQISSQFFDYSWRLWQSDMQTILLGFSTLAQSYNPNALEQHHDELYLISERWLLCLKIIRQLITSGFPSDAKSVQVVTSSSFLFVFQNSRVLYHLFWQFIQIDECFDLHFSICIYFRRSNQ